VVCVLVPLLLKRNVGVLFGVLEGLRSDAPIFSVLLFCNYFMVIIYIYIYIYTLMYFCKFILCVPTCTVVMSSCFLFAVF
jgi:hypothetical protein